MTSRTGLARWRANPISFIEEVLINPETGKPFVLLKAERAFLEHAFATGPDGRLLYPEQIYSCPKKSGKTTFAALLVITFTLLFGGSFAEAICAANDHEQSVGRVFTAIKRIIECSPLLRKEAKITTDKINIADAVISAITSNYASAAGANPVITVFDEIWAYGLERLRRLFDELVPPPTRRIACRLIVTYAGFEGESALLHEIYQRGLQQPKIGDDLYAGDGLLMFWSHKPIAPWQTDTWIDSMRRSLRPYQFMRMIENRFVSAESNFVEMSAWDRCIDPNLGHMVADRTLPIWVGVDASIKHDSTALAAVTWSPHRQQVRLVDHRIFSPRPDRPINFDAEVEQTIREWNRRFRIRAVWYDPYQMAASSQRLRREGVPMQEYAQSASNLTAVAENLFTLIEGGNVLAYPDAAMRTAMSRACAVEGARGWKIAKEKQSHRIDIIVALAMAALACVKAQNKPGYDPTFSGWVDPPNKSDGIPWEAVFHSLWRRGF
jgi:phage terminase large subunit-like protein